MGVVLGVSKHNERRSSGVVPEASVCASAKQATTTEEVVVEEDYDAHLWGLSDEIEREMGATASFPKPPSGTQDAKKFVQAQQVDFRGSKALGTHSLVAGRAPEATVGPAVMGGCIFNMSEAYADALGSQSVSA